MPAITLKHQTDGDLRWLKACLLKVIGKELAKSEVIKEGQGVDERQAEN